MNRGLPTALVLAPDVRISPHPAPMSRFQKIGDFLAWGLAAPGALRAERNEWLWQGLGGPTQAVALLGWDRRACQGAGAAHRLPVSSLLPVIACKKQ